MTSEVAVRPEPKAPSNDSIIDAIETLARVFHAKLAGLNTEPSKRGYNREEAAAYLGCSTGKIDQLVNEGKLKAHYYMRWPTFDIQDLKKFFDA